MIDRRPGMKYAWEVNGGESGYVYTENCIKGRGTTTWVFADAEIFLPTYQYHENLHEHYPGRFVFIKYFFHKRPTVQFNGKTYIRAERQSLGELT